MKKTSFGKMLAHELPPLSGTVERMVFETAGRPHSHEVREYALCVAGSGRVYVGEAYFNVIAGDLTTIPPGLSHYMVPDPGGMSFVLFYEASNGED